MREDKNRYNRVSRRSSTGTRKGSAERDRRERIRVFDDTDDFYQNENTGERYSETREQPRRDSYESDRRYDEDRYYESDRPGERDRYREDRRYEDDRRYDRDDRRDDDRRREGRQRADRREGRNTPRKQAGGNRRRRAGGDTERFVHQIVPYAMFWVALFGAVSFILRDLIGLDGSTGAFGNWFANFLCGLF
ncbi:MAG: hypothetical protein J6A84_00970, partial [Clostridia bacterium]|nr:hypothetical protein [Clostridia bacterium]